MALAPHELIIGGLAALAVTYSVFCWGMCGVLRAWGRSADGRFLREYTITRRRHQTGSRIFKRTSCFDIGYTVDGRDYVLTLKNQLYTITIGFGRLRRAVMSGMPVYYFPNRPGKGYVLRQFLSHAINSAMAGAILSAYFFWQR